MKKHFPECKAVVRLGASKWKSEFQKAVEEGGIVVTSDRMVL